MSLLERINADFMSAYKSKETMKKDFLGLIKSEVTKESKDPTDQYIVSKIKSMIKSAESTNSLSNEELEWLEVYLPTQMTDQELESEISSIVELIAADSIKEMGAVMAELKTRHNGTYDGKKASEIIKRLLQ